MTQSELIQHIKKSPVAKLNEHLFLEGKPKKKSKYFNKKIELDNYTFDSVKESQRYLELRALQIIGEITCLNCQTPFQLSVCKYIADFTYKNADNQLIVEDVKSKITRRLAVYRLKKKLMLAELGMEIVER